MADDKKVIRINRPSKKMDDIQTKYLNEALDIMKDHIPAESKTKKTSPSTRRKKPTIVQTATGSGNTQVAGDLVQHYYAPPRASRPNRHLRPLQTVPSEEMDCYGIEFRP